MTPLFVLVHSLFVGPMTWEPVAGRLIRRGWPVAVPSLLPVVAAGAPYWPGVVDAIHIAMNQTGPGQPVIVIAHSNAGLFVPAIVAGAPRPVTACLFVDTGLPGRDGATPTMSPQAREFLRPRTSGGLLPRWTDWWDEAEVAALVPDRALRELVVAEQPRLPASYTELTVPNPHGWDDRRCAYLFFGPPYDRVAADARARGWAVDHLPGGHLHQLVDPDGVTDRLLRLAEPSLSGGR